MPRNNSDADELIDWLSALGDVTRLRILRLLAQEELGVGELARIIQTPQSTVSRHLKVLLESGWVAKRPVGTASMYRFDESAVEEDAGELWRIAKKRLEESGRFRGDASRLQEVLAERRTDSKAFFGRIGSEWDQLRNELFGDRFTTDALLAFIEPNWIVADLGCGTGNAAEQLAPLVKKVIAVDREPAMLDAAKNRLERYENIEFRRGELTKLPLENNEVDAALVFLVMHHVEQPVEAVREIARALKPGGVMMLVDMVAHSREEYRHTMGHLHLGFSEEEVRGWADAAGLHDTRYVRLRPDIASQGPGLFVATLRK